MQQKHKWMNIGLGIAAALPMGIALSLCAKNLYTIWPDLTVEQATRMALGLVIVAVPSLGSVSAALIALRRKEGLSWRLIAGLLGMLMVCFFCFFSFVEPRVSFREWLFDHDAYLMAIISGLIPLFYYLLFYLAHALAIQTRRGLIISILSTVLLPAIAYFGFALLRFVTQMGTGHIWQVGALVLTATFSFFVLRLMVYVLQRKAEALTQPRAFAALQFFFIGLFPMLGLALNTWGPLAHESQRMLGNFSGSEFWILAAINAALYLVPTVQYYPLRFALLALRTAGFTFVLYFCVAFILFLPLAVILIPVIGLGLLLLIPYLAAVVQGLRLKKDLAELASSGRKNWAIAGVVIGTLILPVGTLVEIYFDRAQLGAAIRYLEQPPLTLNHPSPIDAETVLRLADMPSVSASRGRGFRHHEQNLPIYDALYRQIVLDGADLSETTRRRIRTIFGGANEGSAEVNPTRGSAELGDVQIVSAPQGNLTESTLSVKVKNALPGRDAEFSEHIQLGSGTFLTGHWLTIDGVEIPAQITNRNTAIWVFNRVTEAQRDPSLIYYEGKDLLRWRIFPVPGAGERKARLTISHAHDVDIRIAGKIFSLKAQVHAPMLAAHSGKAELIAPAAANTTRVRKPYLHFIADCSVGAKLSYEDDVKIAAQKIGTGLDGAKISYVNTAIHSADLSQGQARCPQRREGFFTAMAMKAILYAQFEMPSDSYPLLVVLSPQRLMVNRGDLSHITAFYGDADGFYHLDGKALQPFSFSPGTTGHMPRINLPVRAWKGRYYPADQRTVIGTGVADTSQQTKVLEGIARFYDFYLGKTENRALAVLAAVETGVLNPAAGSIVLETEAQRRRLAELHKKLLNARNQLETGAQPRMSEPWAFFLMGLGFVTFVAWRRRKAMRAKIAWFDEEA